MTTFGFTVFLITFLLRINESIEECDTSSHFTCNDGSCIDSFLVCDGAKDCPDTSDETEVECSKANIRCPSKFSFRCAYGACINKNEKCDGKPDCADGSDEELLECPSNTTSTLSQSTNDICPEHSFACNSKQCINSYDVCDGELNCNDESDETKALCKDIICPPAIGFKCAYGACIDIDKQCDNIRDCKDGSDEDPSVCGSSTTRSPLPTRTSPSYPPSSSTFPPTLKPNIRDQTSCILPDHQFGRFYTILGCDTPEARFEERCRVSDGFPIHHSAALLFDCNKNYGFEPNVNKLVICYNGNWHPPIPTCLKLCHPLKSNSLRIKCTYRDAEVDCNSPMLPNTKARFDCKSSYRYQGPDVSHVAFCDDEGSWTESLFKCKPACGLRNTKSPTLLISHGVPTSAVEYPWHTALYKFDPKLNDQEMFCGGTIITPYMILTAAHCFYKVTHAKEVTAIVGKTNRSFHINDIGEQRMQVSRIFNHPEYAGSNNRHSYDVAILELSTNIEVGSSAMPVCFDTIPPWTILETGTPGTAVGFGKDENGKPTDQLMVVNLPYLDRQTCWLNNVGYRDYITQDKFCATYTEGAGVQKGDSGGGLVFLKDTLYYIEGIVSSKFQDQNSYAVFTNLSWKANFDFVKEIKEELDKRRA